MESLFVVRDGLLPPPPAASAALQQQQQQQQPFPFSGRPDGPLPPGIMLKPATYRASPLFIVPDAVSDSEANGAAAECQEARFLHAAGLSLPAPGVPPGVLDV